MKTETEIRKFHGKDVHVYFDCYRGYAKVDLYIDDCIFSVRVYGSSEEDSYQKALRLLEKRLSIHASNNLVKEKEKEIFQATEELLKLKNQQKTAQQFLNQIKSERGK